MGLNGSASPRPLPDLARPTPASTSAGPCALPPPCRCSITLPSTASSPEASEGSLLRSSTPRAVMGLAGLLLAVLLCSAAALWFALMTEPGRLLASVLDFLRAVADSTAWRSEGVCPVRLTSLSARYSALNRGLFSLGAAGASRGSRTRGPGLQAQGFEHAQAHA